MGPGDQGYRPPSPNVQDRYPSSPMINSYLVQDVSRAGVE